MDGVDGVDGVLQLSNVLIVDAEPIVSGVPG